MELFVNDLGQTYATRNNSFYSPYPDYITTDSHSYSLSDYLSALSYRYTGIPLTVMAHSAFASDADEGELDEYRAIIEMQEENEE